MSPSLDLTDRISALWIRSLSKHYGRTPHPKGKARLTKFIRERLLKPILQDGGEIILRHDPKNQITAAILIKSGGMSSEYRPKLPFWSFMVFTFPGDKKSEKWVLDRLSERKTLLQQGCSCVFDPWQSWFIPRLSKLGIYPTSVILKGEVNIALKRLKKHYGDRLLNPLMKEDLKVERVFSIHEIDQYIRVIKQEFTRNPQFGSFVSEDTFLNGLRVELIKDFKKNKSRLWLVKKGARVLGGVDYSIMMPDLTGKKRSSFGVNLHQSLQGKNIARCLYAVVLEDLKRNKIFSFRGGTAQPGVMKLAKVMDRKLDGIVVERLKKPFFKSNYFKDWIG